MNNNDHPQKKQPLYPTALGFGFCMLSAIGYTVTNIVLRRLAELQVDPMWVICVKESVTTITVGLWLLLQAVYGRRARAPLKTIGMLILVGLGTQFLGNVNMQWSFGIVGLAIAVPLSFGAMLTCGAIGGWWFLGEKVSRRKALALVVLVGGIVLLSMGANTASEVVAASTIWATVAIGTVCLAGTMFGLLAIGIRRASLANVPTALIVVIITGVGVVCLGPLCLARLGAKALLETPPDVFGLMLLAGVLNLVSFLAIAKGLQLTTVIYANIINSSQVAIAALAGIVLFGEPTSPWLLLGMATTVLGILLINRPTRHARVDVEM